MELLKLVVNFICLGGRIFSHEIEEGVFLELGAHYLHGTPGNPIYDFSYEKGIMKEFKDELGIVVCYFTASKLKVFFFFIYRNLYLCQAEN